MNKREYDRQERRIREKYGMEKSEFDALCDYNAEVSRGLLHTEEHKERMAVLQRLFDAGRERIEASL